MPTFFLGDAGKQWLAVCHFWRRFFQYFFFLMLND